MVGRGFIRWEVCEKNEGGKKKKNGRGKGRWGDIFGGVGTMHWRNGCFGNSTFGIFTKPELALLRSSFFNPYYTNVHHNPPPPPYRGFQ